MAENGGRTSGQVFQSLNRKQKLQFIYDYYKIPILIVLAGILLLLSILHSVRTRKEEILTVALVNVRLPEKAEAFLGKYYLEKNGYSARRQTVTVMDQLFVPSGASKAPPAEVPFKETQNHTNPEGSSSTETLSPEETNPEYAYAAQMKLVAMLGAGELDVLLMDEDALAYFEQNKALLPHPSSCTYRSLEGTAFYQKAGFTGKVYVGIAANTKHRREAVNYLKYLSGDFR